MLNYLWGFMILIGLSVGIVTGEVEAVSNAAIDSAGEAVTLAITMLGIMSLWTGLIEIAKASGLLERLTKDLRPVLHFLFPRIPKEHVVNEYIAANMIANILGLGWAATPMGLKAMKALADIERERVRTQSLDKKYSLDGKQQKSKGEHQKEKQKKTAIKASDEMCSFLVINISSLQVIPVNIIAYRSKYGSVNPTAIVVPALVATLVSTAVGVLFCKLMCKNM